MIYKKERIMIRPLKKEDLCGNYLKWRDDPIVTKYNSHGLFPQSEKGLKEFSDSLDFKNQIIWAILYENFHIGNVSLQSINWTNRSGELAIMIGEHQNHKLGIGTVVCNFVLEHGFNKLNLHRIWSGTANPNIGMQKVFKKLGFIQEGIFQDATFLNGKYEDIICYGLLEDEWRDDESDVK